MKWVINFIRGFCMALADSVPGVSGGTIAFLLGFYDKFIGSLNSLFSGTKEERKEAILFLIKLGIGWVTGFLIAVSILANVFEKEIYKVSSLFIGFIIFAIPIVIMEEKDTLKGKYKNLIFTAIGIAVVVAISLLNPVSGQGISVEVGSLNVGIIIYTFIVAMVAISAMVLPGISGSTLLLIFGLYVPIISAIKELMHLNFAYLPIIIIFGLGILVGIFATIKLIKKGLEKHRSPMIYGIIGMMIGSLYAIVVGPTTLKVPQPAMSFGDFSILFFLMGAVVIIGLQALKYVMEKKTK